ncbi:TetR/AcrR family transcriptional regulator [Paenibacillaceae bacterium]|nr:TetR/AcrR family transcriptional regulator [Paenibacillaceae bacterium]
MDLKTKIAEAAELVLLTNGLAKTTTKEIARAAGCSEGSLYNHFRNKEDIFLHVLRGQLKNLMGVLTSLQGLVGKETVQHNLEKVAVSALEDYTNSMPLICSIFSEPDILLRHREGFVQRNEGPHRANEAVAAYLMKEQESGRIMGDIDARVVADCVLGSCFQHAFQLNFTGKQESHEERFNYARRIVNTLFPDK